MKRLNLFLPLFLCPILMFGQLKVTSTGDVIIGSTLRTSINNVPVVFKSGSNLAGSTGSSGSTCVSFGYLALYKNTTGTGNTATGFYALYNNTTGTSNTAAGYYSLYTNTGSYNTATGYKALYSNTTGGSNTATGYQALYYNTGYNNTATGCDALYSNRTGINNTAVGYVALNPNTTGNGNTAYGSNALRNNTTGSYNTAVGCSSNPYATNQTNTTAIGYGAQTTANDQVRLGNNLVTSIGGYANWSTVSDGRTKKNISAEVPGLAFINLLQPVTYNLDLDAIDEIQKSDDPKINHLSDSLRTAQSPEEREILATAKDNKEKQVYSGFIAQDVEKAARSVGYDFSGVDAPENDKSTYGLRYAEFVVPLVKAVQELSEQNSKLQEQINELTAKLYELTNVPKSTNTGGTVDESAKNFSFSLFPNPTTGFVTIDYTLYEDAPISIELYNMFGQRVKAILPNQDKKAGQYSVQASVSGLGVGMYIVKITSGNQVESKQLVINH